MELEKRSIHMNRQKCRTSLQITIDSDINVPDIKPDIGKIIKEQGEIWVNDAKAINNRAVLKGELKFHILYIDEENEYKISHMEGIIDINEVVNLNDSCGDDSIWVQAELEDLTSSVINSRKISIKAVVKLSVSAEEIIDEEAAVAVVDGENTEQLVELGTLTELSLCKKDIYRIKEDIIIPPGRDSISEILFSDLILQNVETRMLQNKFGIRGEIKVFILYRGVENDRINSYETTIPFDGDIDCMGCDENMISRVDIRIRETDIQIKEDEDGEERTLEVEAVLDLDMRVYSEDSIQLLTDVYSTSIDIIPEYKDIFFNELIFKNNSKTKIQEHIKMAPDDPAILQLCNAGAYVRIDEETTVPGGIEVEGVLEISLLYFTDEDVTVMGSHKSVIPFSHFIEAKDINKNCIYEIIASVDRINVIVTDEREIDVKAVIALDTIVFDVISKKIITGFKATPKETASFKDVPGMTGYVVQKGDSLWSIAKEFSTKSDLIKKMNDLETDEIIPGQKLLLARALPEV